MVSQSNEKGAGPQGFRPEVMETFFVSAEVVFGDHDGLRAVLEHLRAERLSLAVSSIKVCKYSPNQPRALLSLIEHQVYASICPHID